MSNLLDMPEVAPRAAYYHEQARQIRALVALVISPQVKTELLAIAEQFERLADAANHGVDHEVDSEGEKRK